jgi:hypothetical protein
MFQTRTEMDPPTHEMVGRIRPAGLSVRHQERQTQSAGGTNEPALFSAFGLGKSCPTIRLGKRRPCTVWLGNSQLHRSAHVIRPESAEELRTVF